MNRFTPLVAVALLTAFGACTGGQSKAPAGAAAPAGATIPAGELTQVSLELPGMD